MDYITLNQAFTAVIEIPESINTNTVTYTIYKASSGAVFASGNVTFIAGINWKVAFTPTTENETYIVEVYNQTLDVKYSQNFRCVRNATMTASVTSDTEATAAEMLVEVNKAINSFIKNGAAQSYTINGRTFMRADLDKLIKWRIQLKREIASANGYGRTYAKFVDTN